MVSSVPFTQINSVSSVYLNSEVSTIIQEGGQMFRTISSINKGGKIYFSRYYGIIIEVKVCLQVSETTLCHEIYSFGYPFVLVY